MKKTILLAVLLIGLTGMAVAQAEINVSQSSDEYDTTTAEPIEMNLTTNITDVEDILMYTNETGDFEPHQVYTQSIDSYANHTNATFEWTNQNNMLEQDTVQYYFQIDDGNITQSQNKSFQYTIYPVIQNVSLEEEINSREIIEIDAEILHPIGPGRLQATEITIETPTNQESTVKMRDTQPLTQDHLSGYIYRGSFGQTTAEGEYTAIIKARDEYREVTKEVEFEVQTDGISPGGGTRLSPAYIGQASIMGSLNFGQLQANIYAQIAGGLLLVSTLILVAAVLGGAGTEENDFTDHQDFAR